MNRINFLSKSTFPPSSDTLDMMQQTGNLTAKLALLGGISYILSGCQDSGNGVVSDGVVVINGEILPFESGIKKEKITVEQTSKNLSAFGIDYPEAYIIRTAKFADGGEYNWSDFARVLTNRELDNRIRKLEDGQAPVGSVRIWAGAIAKIPEGWLLCDGSAYSSEDYPDLCEAIGFVYTSILDIAQGLISVPDFNLRTVTGSGPAPYRVGGKFTYGTYVSTANADDRIAPGFIIMNYIIRAK